jgi:hypothetical protein
MTEWATQASIEQACRMLRLPTIRGNFGELAESTAVNRCRIWGSWPNCCWPNATTGPAAAPSGVLRRPRFRGRNRCVSFDFDANPHVDPANHPYSG